MSTSPQRAREALAAAIREVRGRRNLTQEQVAIDAGLNRKTIGSLERAESLPSFMVLAAIANAMNVSLSELIGVYEKRLSEP